ncbi:MAG TPA: HAD family hydrolase, partial [Methylomirabilota bacterium]
MTGTPRVRAVLFDLDGTLYRQPPLRALMAAELSTIAWLTRRPGEVPVLWQALRTFRRVREELRALGAAGEPLATLQYVEAARRAGLDASAIEGMVEEWMYRRPLKYLRWVARPEAREVLLGIRALGLRVGVFSDYPADEKLAELGLLGAVTLRLCATDPEINAFKPHPAGFLRACAL